VITLDYGARCAREATLDDQVSPGLGGVVRGHIAGYEYVPAGV
jgi:hypothetical protein